MTAGSGRRCFDSYVRLVRPTLWVKTFLASLLTTKDYYSPLSSLTWRLRGTRSQRLSYFRLVPSVPYIEGIGSGFLPTPDTTTGAPNKGSNKKNGPKSLIDYARLIPTPSASDFRDPNRERITARRIAAKMKAKNGNGFGLTLGNFLTMEGEGSGFVNPTWKEWLMGFPLNWSEVEASPSETPSSPKQPS